MNLSAAEQTVMDRFAQKTHIAGGPRAGYVLRKQAVGSEQEPDFDLDGGIAALVDKGLLATSEGGEWVYLTPEGAAQLAGTAS